MVRSDVAHEPAPVRSGEARDGQRLHHRIEALPVSRSFTVTAVNDQLFGMLCNRRVEVVVKHAQCCFLRPSLRGYLRSSSGAERAASYTSRCVH